MCPCQEFPPGFSCSTTSRQNSVPNSKNSLFLVTQTEFCSSFFPVYFCLLSWAHIPRVPAFPSSGIRCKTPLSASPHFSLHCSLSMECFELSGISQELKTRRGRSPHPRISLLSTRIVSRIVFSLFFFFGGRTLLFQRSSIHLVSLWSDLESIAKSWLDFSPDGCCGSVGEEQVPGEQRWPRGQPGFGESWTWATPAANHH